MPLRRDVSLALCILLFLLSAASAHSAESTHGFQVQARFRLAGGAEETVRLDDFQFIYYDRRFIQKPTGFGKPGRLEIKDIPHETSSVQDEEGNKIKFKHLQSVRLEYQGDAGKRQLVLVATFKKKKKPPKILPAVHLRNTSVAKSPHFRGQVQGQMMDLQLPDLAEPETPPAKILVGLDFVFPGQKPRRDWF
jgi:hypothetical protein